jgi:hypothetical protein
MCNQNQTSNVQVQAQHSKLQGLEELKISEKVHGAYMEMTYVEEEVCLFR